MQEKNVYPQITINTSSKPKYYPKSKQLSQFQQRVNTLQNDDSGSPVKFAGMSFSHPERNNVTITDFNSKILTHHQPEFTHTERVRRFNEMSKQTNLKIMHDSPSFQAISQEDKGTSVGDLLMMDFALQSQSSAQFLKELHSQFLYSMPQILI